MDKPIDAARFAHDPAEYRKNVEGVVALGMHDVPVIPIAQPLHYVALQKTIGGYNFWPSREPDFRFLTKA
jgi:peptide/nickel transport system substrate-binding protein